MRSAFRTIRQVPIAGPLLGTTAVSVVLGWLINREFNVALAAAVPSPHLFADYFAEVAAVVSATALLAQLGAVARVMTRLGVVGTLALAPAMLLGPTLVLVVSPDLRVATACRVLEQLCGLALVSASVDTMSTAIAPRHRTAFMTVLRTVATPLAMAAAGGIVLAERFIPDVAVRAVIPLLVGISLAMLVGLRRRYLDTLLGNLASGDESLRLDSLNALDTLSDRSVDHILVQGLSSPQPDVAIFALELLREPGFENIVDSVPACLTSSSARVRAEAVRTLTHVAPTALEERVWALLDDAEPAVRAAAAEAVERLLGRGDDAVCARAIRIASRRLDEESEPLVCAALVDILVHAGAPDVPERVAALLDRGDGLAAARSLAAVRADDAPVLVDRLLHHDDRTIRIAAARALRGPFDPPTLATLVAMLREPDLADAAAEALSTCRPADLALLRRAFEVEPRISARVHICDILGRMATPDAVEVVIGALRDSAARVRAAAVRALHDARVPVGGIDLAPPLIAAAEHIAILRVQLASLSSEALLLKDELERQLEESRAALSVLVSLAAWGADEKGAHALLEEPREERQRGISVELVETAVPAAARKAVVAVIEGSDAEAAVPWKSMTARQVVEALAESPDHWVARCARFTLEEGRGESAMLTLMEKVLFLRQVDLLRGIPGRDLAVVAELAREERFVRDQTIFEEGAEGDRLYLIIEGSIAVVTAQRIVAIMGVRECFGEMALLSGEKRSASIQALEDTRVLTLRRDDFRDLIVKYPHIAFPIFEILARRLKKTTEMLSRAPQPAAVE